MTQVHPDLAPTEAWTYAVNGKAYRGTAASPPIVVNQGDKVEITFVNGGSKEMTVNMPHSIDFHSAEVAPNKNYIDIAPGKELKIKFTADHAGVFMYHCATQPILLHTSAGMMGMMVVKPRNLAPVDRELWVTQEEYYLGAPGKPADMAKMAAGTRRRRRLQRLREPVQGAPDHGPQGREDPHVRAGRRPEQGQRVPRDRHRLRPDRRRGHRRPRLADDQPGAEPGRLGRVHARRGGPLPVRDARLRRHGQGRRGHPAAPRTRRRPPAGGEHGGTHGAPAAAKADVNATLGDMWVKADKTTVKAGKVTFAVKNTGATMHGLAIAPAPAKAPAACSTRARSSAKGEDLAAGASGTLTADLKPGKYELVCYVPGHYMAGQKLAFEVT